MEEMCVVKAFFTFIAFSFFKFLIRDLSWIKKNVLFEKKLWFVGAPECVIFLEEEMLQLRKLLAPIGLSLPTLLSISSTFYTRLFRTEVFEQLFFYLLFGFEFLAPIFCTKNACVNCRWNWLLGAIRKIHSTFFAPILNPICDVLSSK